MEHEHDSNHSGHMHHESEHNHSKHHHNHERMALSATLHCLTGCAIGEMAGMLIGVSLGLNMLTTVILSIALAFIFGYSLSAYPLIKSGIKLSQALKLVLLADTLSIFSMEIAENLIMVLIPGAMNSGVGNPLFWASMAIAFTVGGLVAYPVNKILLKRGKGHAITHEATGNHNMDNKPLIYGLTAFMLGGLITALFS